MSSAFYPLGMNSYNNRLPQGGYKSWKGTGVFSNPVGITAGNIRPLRNKDPTNSAPQKFGLPRPLQHYRKGIVVTALNNNSNNSRLIKSSSQVNLIGQMMDIPGGYTVKPNTTTETSNTIALDRDCKTCQGIGIIDNWKPITNLTEKPQAKTQTQQFCCNQERNAIIRVLPTSSNITKNANLPNTYYTTLQQYRNNRCQTYPQKAFDFQSVANPNENTYNSMCQPANGACKLSVYKPNNPQFAQQGAVKSSTRTFKRAVTTVQSRIALYNDYYYGYGKPLSLRDDVVGPHIEIPFVLKNKVSPPTNETCNIAQNNILPKQVTDLSGDLSDDSGSGSLIRLNWTVPIDNGTPIIKYIVNYEIVS